MESVDIDRIDDSISHDDTASFILVEVKQRLAYQSDQINALDTKANFVLASASVILVAAAGVLQGIEVTRNERVWGFDRLPTDTVSTGLMVAIAVTYLITILFAGLAYHIRSWHFSPDPRRLIETAWNLPMGHVRSDHLAQLVFDFEANETGITAKSRWLKGSFLMFLIEAVLLTILAAIVV